ncbi:MAG: hypothetical protein IT372_06090 [Polyangiaceae bacterium]|nr:hypothetical protein [Polyangiaceae bacterium]
MPERTGRRFGRWIGVALAMATIAVLAAVILRWQELPQGVQPVAWEREVCARCRMHIGDPHFAAQLQTRDGRILNFDDPGCLILYEVDRAPDVHAIYFHLSREDAWASQDDVAFVPGQTTPMGYGFGAVRRGTPGALPYAEVRQRLSGQREGGGPR